MRRGGPRGLSRFQAGVILIAAVVIVTYLGFTKAIPFRHHFQIQADFKTASTIAINSHVRIAGVNVGRVTSIDSLHSDRPGVRITMRIDKMGRPIHKDATLALRPNVFLEGNQFVDLHPGSPTAPVLGDGDVIPESQTATPVQLDQVLTALQSDTRRHLQRLLPELSTALYGPGGIAYNRSIQYWLPAFKGSAIVNQATLGEAPHDLSRYLAAQGRFAAALDRNPPALKSLITDLNRTAAAFASEQTALENTISELPRTLRAARPALAALNTSFPPLRRLTHDLRPAARSTGPMIDATLPFITQLRLLVQPSELQGVSSDLRLLTPNLARLNAHLPSLLRQQRLASSCQNRVILPWSRDKVGDPVFDPNGKVYQESVKFLPGLGEESRSGDANGQWQRTLGGNGPFTYKMEVGNSPDRFGVSNFPLQGTLPPSMHQPDIRYDVPCETQQPPNLDAKPGPPLEKLEGQPLNPFITLCTITALTGSVSGLALGPVEFEDPDKVKAFLQAAAAGVVIQTPAGPIVIIPPNPICAAVALHDPPASSVRDAARQAQTLLGGGAKNGAQKDAKKDKGKKDKGNLGNKGNGNLQGAKKGKADQDEGAKNGDQPDKEKLKASAGAHLKAGEAP
jgi:phospholipid/cholesterol/gamma-HCH transport system substrate-binding protein